jgi:hypothetical protein
MAFKRWARDARSKFIEYTAQPFQQARTSVVRLCVTSYLIYNEHHTKLDGTEARGMVPDALSDIIAGTSKYKEEELVSAASSIHTGV